MSDHACPEWCPETTALGCLAGVLIAALSTALVIVLLWLLWRAIR